MFWNRISSRFSRAGLLLALLPGMALAQGNVFSSAADAPSAAAVPAAFAYQLAASAKATAAGPLGPAESREISVDLGLLAGDPDQLRVELPDGRSYLAYRSASWTEEGQRRYWSGELHRDGVVETTSDGRISLSAEGEFVAGSVSAEGASFEILPQDAGRQFLIELAPAARGAQSAGSHCTLVETGGGPVEKGDETQQLEAVAPKGDMTTKPRATAVIDVLTIFPRSLAADPTMLLQTRARIGALFADANLVLANSGANARFRIVYSGSLYGDQPPVAANSMENSPQLGVLWMQGNRPEVLGLRDAWNADLVALFLPGDSNINCGAAEVENPGTVPGNPNGDQYAAIDIGCASGEYLVAHELGHLLGMLHPVDEYPMSDPPSSPYAFASGFDATNQLYVYGQRAATVVACNGNNNGAPNPTLTGIQCNRIPYYSSPNIQVGGVTIGSATANNAEVARLQAPITAQRRPSLGGTNLPPIVTLLRPQGTRAQSQQEITLSARAWDTEDGDLGSSIQWSSNRRGSLGSGTLLRVWSNLLGPEIITASVMDSGGLVFSRSVPLVFEPMVNTDGAIWHDPSKPGHFLSFNKNMFDQWVATWMTYEGSNPVWYQSNVVPVSPTNGSFRTHLVRYTRDAWTGVQSGTYFGEITIVVETERQIRLYVQLLGAPVVDLMLEPYTHASGPGSYWSVIDGQVDPGWMIWRGPTTFGPFRQEARMLITFDGPEPVWVLAVGSPPELPSSAFGLTMIRPTAGSITNNYQLPATGVVGNLIFTSSGTAASVSLIFPSGYSWVRVPAQPIQPATVR